MAAHQARLSGRCDSDGMSLDLSRASAPGEAAAAADAAARAAGLTIAEVEDIATLSTAARLMDEVWSNSDDAPLISPAILKALAHSGGYVSVAFAEGDIVGALVGFPGWLNGGIQLHSHILGVSPSQQGRSIGFALKQHQRAWALARDIGTITWTFDPLVRRNAYFNLTKLGASITAYYENFYGEMSDAINAGDESDRVLVEWNLRSASVAERSEKHGEEPDVDALRAGGAAIALTVLDNGSPSQATPGGADVLLAQVPGDIVGMRERAPGSARAWRHSLRSVLGPALGEGYAASGMSRSGWYVLTKERR
jgi:predicted GNAT superfamily acetyltransferase